MHAAATGRVSKGGPEGPEGPEGSLPNMLGRRPDGAALGGHGPARPAHACTCIRRLLPHRDHGDDPCEAHCPAKVTSARALAFPVPNRFQPAFSLNHPVNKYMGSCDSIDGADVEVTLTVTRPNGTTVSSLLYTVEWVVRGGEHAISSSHPTSTTSRANHLLTWSSTGLTTGGRGVVVAAARPNGYDYGVSPK